MFARSRAAVQGLPKGAVASQATTPSFAVMGRPQIDVSSFKIRQFKVWHAACDGPLSMNQSSLLHPFLPMSDREREAFPDHYMSWLRARDGMPCLSTRTLSRREDLSASSGKRPVHDKAPPRIDPEVFSRNLARCEPEPGLDRATIWALAVAKGNRAERYGVEHKLAVRGFEPGGADDILTYVELQEVYHTRLLLQVLALVGLHCEVGAPVGAVTRKGIRFMASLPRYWLDVLALPFEVVGITAFSALREEARELFADHPEIERIDAFFAQILVDEVGHVHYLRSRLGTVRLAMSSALLPFAKTALFDDNHEVKTLLERRGTFTDLGRTDVDAVVMDAPDRLPPLAA